MNDLLNFAKTIVTPPTDATLLVEHNKKEAKARMLILDAVRDHIIPHILGKKATREMWEALTKLYQSDNHNRKMALRDKLRSDQDLQDRHSPKWLHSHGMSSLQGLLLGRIFLSGSACGMTSSRRRLEGSHYMEVSREEMKRRTYRKV